MVKWGIGVENVDSEACKDLGIPIINTPGMFGAEVADIAVGYVIALACQPLRSTVGLGQVGVPSPGASPWRAKLWP